MEENLRLICRICLCPIEPLKATSINQRAEKLHFEDILLKDVIEKCISEMVKRYINVVFSLFHREFFL